MKSKKKAIILMGLPLAGKSTVLELRKEKYKGYWIISADAYKENHPDYDVNDNEELHQWSVMKAQETFEHFVKSGDDCIVDGGGINNKYTLRMVKLLNKNDYHITLLHVKTPYQVCLERNKLRERKVPVKAILDKAVIEMRSFHRLKGLVDEIEIIDYFTNKHIFLDMDGVLAAQSVLPIIDGKIDFTNGEIHKWQDPVTPVIDKLYALKNRGYILYILSAAANSVAQDEKREWLSTHFPIVPDRRVFFVNAGRHKVEMLENLRRKFKLKNNEVLLVDDFHKTIQDVRAYNMNSMHISEFLTQNFE